MRFTNVFDKTALNKCVSEKPSIQIKTLKNTKVKIKNPFFWSKIMHTIDVPEFVIGRPLESLSLLTLKTFVFRWRLQKSTWPKINGFLFKKPNLSYFFKAQLWSRMKKYFKVARRWKRGNLIFSSKRGFFFVQSDLKEGWFFQNPFLLLNITSLRTLLSFNIALRFNLEKNILRNP